MTKIFNVELTKNAMHQLGLVIDSEENGVNCITRIIPLQPADLDGRLAKGDHILKVNCVALNTVAQTVRALKTCAASPITITVARNVHQICLRRPVSGIYGFSLAGGNSVHCPLRIRHIQPESAAAASGLKIGNRLETINGISCNTLCLAEANTIIMACVDNLTLLVVG